MKKTLASLLLLLAAAVLCLAEENPVPPLPREDPAAAPRTPTPIDPNLKPLEDRPTVPFAPFKEEQKLHAVALQIHNRNALEDFKTAIKEIADLGADTVTLAVAGYQHDARSFRIRTGTLSQPTPEELGELISLAKFHGLKVIIQPILLLDDPKGSEWRGQISPPDPEIETWWADYRKFIQYYAEPANKAGADVFTVGGELNHMEASTVRWRDLIKFMRKEYPRLKLTYEANWDRYWKIAFWDDLDYAGVTSYYELAPEPRPGDRTPTVDELVKAWNDYDAEEKDGKVNHHYRDKLIAWQRTIGKPVIFSEVGYFSQAGTANAPWNYCLTGPESQEEQANCYKAFLQVWNDAKPQGKGEAARSPADIVGGVVFWEWTISPVGKGNMGYTPKGKLAEKVVRDYFREKAHPETPASQPGGAAGADVQARQIKDAVAFLKTMAGTGRPVLLEFYKGGSPTCRLLDETMDKLADEYRGKAVIAQFMLMDRYFNVTAPELKEKYDISFVPTAILFAKGVERKRFSMDYDIAHYRQALDEAVSQSATQPGAGGQAN